MNLIEQTETLKRYLDNLKYHYEQNDPPENRKDRALFLQVKEETTPIYDRLQQWETLALQFVKERKVNVHPQQIVSTKENMELLLMHSYYIDVRRKRYMELNHSVIYIFDQLMDELNKVDL
ncbi:MULTISPECIES: DUF1798 family protein [Virgibacillus]|uniref:DUF1798 family protein n=2 Tax=Virgibacillus TaxID=84406 RepID=A0A024QD15_9BACI|nr:MULTISPECIES: DUF1798 family protein [Virgibacillus]EQB36145.1 hypothetical protein M948_14000 [Virgibacillus sp. CM-4]MYL42012.1 DUF1798 family protein [Virgibacillus massiliensis]GGJ46290.1 hypothetical protein GCM10007111_05360 [Virgibacillus kapii]CDQ39841.1 hypothetical protein BN990_02155 [Virgibacillus massiliensis]